MRIAGTRDLITKITDTFCNFSNGHKIATLSALKFPFVTKYSYGDKIGEDGVFGL